MAVLKGGFEIEGNVGGLSFYKRRGSDKIIVRSKGGASKQTIKNSPKFEKLRLQQNEWKGCTRFASCVKNTFGGLQRVADYNLTSSLNALAKAVQKADAENEVGTRNIRLSSCRQALGGFNFNRNYSFNSVLKVSTGVEIEREHLRAVVHIPRINTSFDLLNIRRLPYFRISISLGSVSDMVYREDLKQYVPANDKLNGIFQTFTGEWIPAVNIREGQMVEVGLNESLRDDLTEEVTLIVSAAVEFGEVGFDGKPQEVKYAGSGKVLICG